MDQVNEVVELVKDVEAALAIVTTRAATDMKLTLVKAEVEMALTSSNEVKGGVKFGFLDASTNRAWVDGHTLSLELTPKGGTGSAGAKETDALAAGILELVSLHKEVQSIPNSAFAVGTLKLSVQFERTTAGSLQVVGGGGKSAKSTQRVNLTLRPK
jgi:hypothetical protein